MKTKWVPFNVASRETNLSRRTLRLYRSLGLVRTQVETDGRVLFALEDVRKAKRERALRNPSIQHRARRLRSEIEIETGEKPWAVKRS